MKGFITGFLVALYALPAVCAGGVSRVTSSTAAENSGRVVSSESGRNAASRATNSSRANTDTVAENSRTAVSRIVREISPTTTGASRSTTATRVSNRATRTSGTTDAGRSTTRSVRRASGTETMVGGNTRRSGVSVRPTTAAVGGRAIMESGQQTGSNIANDIRKIQPRFTIGIKQEEVKLDPAAIADAKERLEQTAALNKSCQEQYNDCMDQFCAVIDTNQKRCSCSANLAKYSKVEKAVKDANAELNEVAQNIRYVGLSADEISAIMSETEAEEAMSGLTDTSENRSLLKDIEKMIKDPQATTSYSSIGTDSYGLIDINLDFSSDSSSDLFNLDFLSGGNGSFSNLRGSELYNAAKKRCNSVITQCKEVGATPQQITGNYDLAIDKDCVAYEAGLSKMNDTLVSNVRSANLMLQKARLAVLQNHNEYDARGCVSALETCMTDEMVCGENYTKCLDPTKMYIDENGNVVLGKDINTIQDFMVNYNNASIDETFLRAAYSTTINADCANSEQNNGICVVKYLLNKIGTKQKSTAEGLCRPVLDKCRAYTYDDNDNYIQFNDIVIHYIQRAMVNIKAAQYKIISDYASSCLTDIATCYNDQVSQLTTWSATASVNSIYNIMNGACRNVALTCGYAVFADDSNNSCSTPTNCIQNISEIFYQSLLCPDNSVYTNQSHAISKNNTTKGYANNRCRCKDGFVSFNGSCLPLCEGDQHYLANGVCGPLTCDAHKFPINGECRSCPSYSLEVYDSTTLPEGAQVIYKGNCQCIDSGNANDPYLASPDDLYCRKCPTGSHYDGSSCTCDTQGAVYNPTNNCCSDTANCNSGTGEIINGSLVIDSGSYNSTGQEL